VNFISLKKKVNNPQFSPYYNINGRGGRRSGGNSYTPPTTIKKFKY
jgi:hypothetical protein